MARQCAPITLQLAIAWGNYADMGRHYTVTPENQCQAATGAGHRCRRPRQAPRPFCQNHPDDAQVHPEARTPGGNGSSGGIDIPKNPTASDIARISAQAAVRTMEGKMTPQQGAAVAKLMETALKASEKAAPEDERPPAAGAPAAAPDPYAGAPPTEEA